MDTLTIVLVLVAAVAFYIIGYLMGLRRIPMLLSRLSEKELQSLGDKVIVHRKMREARKP